MVGVAMIRQSGVNITIITPLARYAGGGSGSSTCTLYLPTPPWSPIFSQDQP